MTEYVYRVYEGIIAATASELILFFVIVAVVSIPLYVAVMRGRKADKLHEREREKQILEVIKENSTVIAELKVILDNSGDATKAALDRVHTRIDGQGNTITEMASKINKILLIVDNTPNNGSFSSHNAKSD